MLETHFFSTTANKSIYRKIASALMAAVSIATMADVYGKGEFADELGVSGQCTLCHTSPDGGLATLKPAARAAFDEGGIKPGLENFLNSLVTDAKPQILPIDNEWNAQIGELPLSIPLIINDEEKSGFVMELAGVTPSLAPKSFSFSKLYLEAAKKRPTIDFKWIPISKQKITKYTVSFRANEIIDNGSKQFSNLVKTTIFLWPARPVSSKNVIERFAVSTAKWGANKMTLTGNIAYKKSATAPARATALKTLRLNLKSNNGIVVGTSVLLTPNPKTGVWTKTFALTGAQVPCLVKAEYEKLMVARTVRSAPATCKK
jgi:hypothetical protein